MYDVVDVSGREYHAGTAFCINNKGQVGGGGGADGERSQHAFIWEAGELVKLPPASCLQSAAFSINELGHAVGFLDQTEDDLGRACCWGEDHRLGILPEGDRFSGAAYGINNEGFAVGQLRTRPASERPNGPFRAVLWTPDGEVHNIASHHREAAYARGINKSGQVVGHAFDGAFIFERGELTPIGFIDDGHAEAMAINDQGQVVGLADTRRRKFHAFLWQEGSIIDLGTLGGPESQAKDINNDGQIVGRSYTRKDKDGVSADEHGFLWQDGKLLDLNDLIDPQSGWLIKCALGINDHGQIVGDARRNDRDHAVLLNPS